MTPRTVATATAAHTPAPIAAAPPLGTSAVGAVAAPSAAAPSLGAITPDLAAVLQDARPHPQLGPVSPQPPSPALLGRAAAAIAAGLALRPHADEDLAGLETSYLLPPGTRAKVHRAGPAGVLVLAPSDAPRAVAAAGPGIYVVVETTA